MIALLSFLYMLLALIVASIVGLDPAVWAALGGFGMAALFGYTVGASDKPRRAYRSQYRRLTWL